MKLYRCDRCGAEAGSEGNCAMPKKRSGWIAVYRVARRRLAIAAHDDSRRCGAVEPDLCDACEESLGQWWDNPTPATAAR